jgi:PHP family Zn ribbon phosphoesterase
MLRAWAADLHIHTFLSPCASRDMSPGAIIKRCCEVGLDIVAITDHNAAGNVARTMKEAATTGLVVLPGMEVCTSEELHVLTLLPDRSRAAQWEAVVRRALTPGENVPEIFGEQWVQDACRGAVPSDTALLAAPTRLSLADVVSHVTALGGACIPSHVDRAAFSIIGQLGFVPEGLDLAGLEISRAVSRREALLRMPHIAGYGLISSSDAHSLDEIGLGCSLLWIEEPTVAEIILALRGASGRRVEIE